MQARRKNSPSGDSAILREKRAALLERVRGAQDRGAGRVLSEMCAAGYDEILREAFDRARLALSSKEGVDAELVAVGSYGRCSLGPFSDLDVRIVVSGRAALGAELADALLYPLWDAGFPVGHQVLEMQDALALAEQDLATATSLLDMRHVAGARRADDFALEARAHLARRAPKLAVKLAEDAAQRQERFGDSPYLLEPEVKLGTGGLRDLDAIHWAAKLRSAPEEPIARELSAAEELLLGIRNRLHLLAGRRSDRLSFDAQEALGVAMGYADDRAVAAERLMQDYYLAARAVSSARERALAPVTRRSRRDLAVGDLDTQPANALRIFAEAARSGRPIWPAAKDAIARACADPAFCARLRENAEAARLFVELACIVKEVPAFKHGSPMAELHDAGLLVAMIPEFVPVTGRVHHDVYHVLTVDAHSVAALDCLRSLVRGELAKDHPIATHLAAELTQPAALFLATLLHDFGKGHPDRKNHSLHGAELCDVVLPRLGLSPDDVTEARALVANHLALYHVAARRDLDDPDVIAEVGQLVKTRDGLRDLYLLTIADITTTSPSAMTSWKARMLEDLYLKTDAFLSGAVAEGLRRTQASSRVLDEAHPEERDAVERFLDEMPARYLAAHRPEAIIRHARVVQGRRGPCAVELFGSRHDDIGELCIVAYDAPGLLAKIAAALAANRLEVLGAQIHSLVRHGSVEALDVFWVKQPNEQRARGVRRDLEAMLAGTVDARALLEDRLGQASPWRERPSPDVPAEVVIDALSSQSHTIVEVVTKDRPGLLYDLARALHELDLSIAIAKVSTEGAKAIDVFYVPKIESAERLDVIRARLLSASRRS
jgi:[protein-PII] uridylyltransferase